ncbi:MAG: amylo-alpha-1,6-glucosidase [Archaeoglobales archaeon]|nr:MAG: amylo-alpha-1,6-glucosidase [Archaeoglobales archaeon]
MISFGRELKNYEFASKREFVMVSGNAYCSSSLAGNTRKYHGLLVYSNRVYLSALDELVNGKRISVASYVEKLCDDGLKHLQVFNLYPPEFHYFVDGVLVRKTISFDKLLRIRYDVLGEAEIKVYPLVTDRSFHETRKTFEFKQKRIENGFEVGSLRITSNMDVCENPDIYWNVFYERDYERGYECVENLYTPGFFYSKVRDSSVEIVAEIKAGETENTNEKEGKEMKLKKKQIRKKQKNKVPKSPIECLELAADSFLVEGAIYAGYHWFAEAWGRDAFVSLPGLLLERRKFGEAKDVFRFFAKRMRNGIIPNRVPNSYNSSDASLWFIYALSKYFEYKQDREFLSEIKPYVEEILFNYPESDVARLDGHLISVKACSTWMDTRFTPREGKPIEVNALWISSLDFARKIGLDLHSPEKAKREFERFWNPEKNCFYDVIDPLDDSIRPNQVIAIALGLIEKDKAVKALEIVKEKLLTPYGLRTLSPDDKRYKGKYCGDESYHNGCVWPWLMGFYIEALIRLKEPREKFRFLLAPLLEHVREAGLGTISEIFDGDSPYEPNGCISQAWSVAEVLRAYKMLQKCC